MKSVWQDIRYGLRMMAKNPGFTAVAVVTLALGVGANSAVFSIVNALTLRPLAVDAPDRLAAVRVIRADGGTTYSISYPDYEYYRDNNHSFVGMAVAGSATVNWRSGARDDYRVEAALVSGNYFDVLGVKAARGRTFLPDEGRTLGAGPVVVLSDRFWHNRLNGDPAAVGRTLSLNGTAFTVIGIAPPDFRSTYLFEAPDLWAPIMMQPVLRPGQIHLTRGHQWLRCFGRLRESVSVGNAAADVAVMGARIGREFPDAAGGRRVTAEILSPLPGDGRGRMYGVLAILMAVVGLVLLIACGNLANLLLERATCRQREIALRLALGAGRWRIVRQLVVESSLLAMAGAAVSVLLAVWITDAVASIQTPLGRSLPFDLRPGGTVLAYTFLLSLATVLLFGLVPALRATRAAIPALRNSFAYSPSRTRLQNGLAIAQVTICLLVLVTAGLFLRTLEKLYQVDLGFDADRLAAFSLDLNLHRYSDVRAMAFAERLLERVDALPGVESATIAHVTPLSDASSAMRVAPAGLQPDPDDPSYRIEYAAVSPDYLQTMGIRLLSGRDFTSLDREGAPRVTVVNESLARRFWPGQEAVGRLIVPNFGGAGETWEVVGVAADSKYDSIAEDGVPFLYLPLWQSFRMDFSLLVRAAATNSPENLMRAIRGAIAEMDPSVAVLEPRTLSMQVERALALPRAGVSLLTGFGMLSLVLSLVGIYGVIAYAVSRRTREVGIRIALGAKRRDVLNLVMRDGFRLALTGVVIGIALSLGVTRFLASLLFGVSPTDWITFVMVSVVLALATLLASYLPAWRAARVNPNVALRYE